MGNLEAYKKSFIRKLVYFFMILSPALGIISYLAGIVDWFALLNLTVFAPVLLYIPAILFDKTSFSVKFTAETLKLLEIIAMIILVMTSFGTLYAFDNVNDYDNIVHFSTNFFMVLVIFIFLVFYQNNPAKKNWTIIATSSFVGMLALGIGWEYFQKYSDVILGTRMFTDPYQHIAVDMYTDIMFDAIGGFLSASFLLIFEDKLRGLLIKSGDDGLSMS